MTLRFYYGIDSYIENLPGNSWATRKVYYIYKDFPVYDDNYAIHESSDLISHLMGRGLYPVKVEIV